MSVVEQSQKAEKINAFAAETPSLSPTYHRSYHELSEQHVMELDVLTQLHAHLNQLDDLQQRFSFMVREIRGLIR